MTAEEASIEIDLAKKVLSEGKDIMVLTVRKATQQIDNGEFITDEELSKEMKTWW